ncbi:hypothetical protein, partial [Endozoicomonas atrinae]|uniref:hypothetical protein n=1 Tax=Endozoicomonas atrinae TaxID=1333660 RepID=UPI0015865323
SIDVHDLDNIFPYSYSMPDAGSRFLDFVNNYQLKDGVNYFLENKKNEVVVSEEPLFSRIKKKFLNEEGGRYGFYFKLKSRENTVKDMKKSLLVFKIKSGGGLIEIRVKGKGEEKNNKIIESIIRWYEFYKTKKYLEYAFFYDDEIVHEILEVKTEKELDFMIKKLNVGDFFDHKIQPDFIVVSSPKIMDGFSKSSFLKDYIFSLSVLFLLFFLYFNRAFVFKIW